MFLTPDLKPFLGGGYYPPVDCDGDVGFKTVLDRVTDDWTNRRARILEAADNGKGILEPRPRKSDAALSKASAVLSTRVLDKTYKDIAASFDAVDGGFERAPKFPRPVVLNFRCANTCERDRASLSTWSCTRLARWPAAAFTTNWAGQ